MAAAFARLLLATEHTEFDAGAERLAFALAARASEPLDVVLPLVSNPEYESEAPGLAARAEAEAADRLRGLAGAARAAGVTLATRVRRGPEPHREIVDEARRIEADLVVIRRRGRRGLFAQLLIGDMVRNVVTHSPCSVLVAPREARPWTHRILVALDPQSSDMTAVSAAASVAADGSLPLAVLCVAESDGAAQAAAEQALHRAQTTAAAFGVATETLCRAGRPHAQIVATARELGADLLVIGRRGDEGLAHAWLGGVAQKVIGLFDGPVLVAASTPSTPPHRP
jgi:nucleotide-binding universal stress UspA family protein